MIQRTKKTDEVVVREMLDELGRLKPDEIAAKMEREGIKGKPACLWACVIAKYLASLGYECNVGCFIQALDGSFDFLTPASVSEFIFRFDQGHYPELETTGCSQ